PLDLSRHLAKYHYLPTDKIHSMSSHDIIKIIEIIKNRLRYDKFIMRLAHFINMQDARLRLIPKEIQLNDNLWFISLNWCNSDINNNSTSNLLKLHGSCQDYSSMILPTQELRDNFVINDNYVATVAFNLVQRCNTLYLWGTSLSDYDVVKYTT
nr:SIR2 family protein [Burkholderiales bacterium]